MSEWFDQLDLYGVGLVACLLMIVGAIGGLLQLRSLRRAERRDP